MAEGERTGESNKQPSKLLSLEEDCMININGTDLSEQVDFIKDSEISYEYAMQV